MRLLINAMILSDKNTGLGVYTYNLLSYIAPKLEKDNIEFQILCSNKEYLPSNCKDKAIIRQFEGFFQRNKVLNTIDTSKYDVVWSTTQHGVNKIKCHQIITIHDLIPYYYPKGRIHQYIYYKFFLPRILKKCDYVITVSENTKRDISTIYHFDNNKIINAYEAINYGNELTYSELNTNTHFCVTGIHYSYKNIHIIINTFKKYPELKKYKVYIIGNDNCKYGMQLKKIIKKFNLEDNFIFTGFISNDDKNKILRSSIAALYPSLYEGFGLPVLEAMALGVPVISSNSSSLKEVGGDASIYFNPYSEEDLYEKINMVVNLKNRREIVYKGFENLKRFSWEKSGDIILNLLKNVMR